MLPEVPVPYFENGDIKLSPPWWKKGMDFHMYVKDWERDHEEVTNLYTQICHQTGGDGGLDNLFTEGAWSEGSLWLQMFIREEDTVISGFFISPRRGFDESDDDITGELYKKLGDLAAIYCEVKSANDFSYFGYNNFMSHYALWACGERGAKHDTFTDCQEAPGFGWRELYVPKQQLTKLSGPFITPSPLGNVNDLPIGEVGYIKGNQKVELIVGNEPTGKPVYLSWDLGKMVSTIDPVSFKIEYEVMIPVNTSIDSRRVRLWANARTVLETPAPPGGYPKETLVSVGGNSVFILVPVDDYKIQFVIDEKKEGLVRGIDKDGNIGVPY